MPFLGLIFDRHDKWWRFSAQRDFTSRQLAAACDMLIEHGITWLERYDGSAVASKIRRRYLCPHQAMACGQTL